MWKSDNSAVYKQWQFTYRCCPEAFWKYIWMHTMKMKIEAYYNIKTVILGPANTHNLNLILSVPVDVLSHLGSQSWLLSYMGQRTLVTWETMATIFSYTFISTLKCMVINPFNRRYSRHLDFLNLYNCDFTCAPWFINSPVIRVLVELG